MSVDAQDIECQSPPPIFSNRTVIIPENDYHSFFIKCADHDWYYYFSDDARVLHIGERASARLKSCTTMNDVYLDIYDAWYRYKFSGANFGKPEQPLPEWEDFKDAT